MLSSTTATSSTSFSFAVFDQNGKEFLSLVFYFYDSLFLVAFEAEIEALDQRPDLGAALTSQNMAIHISMDLIVDDFVSVKLSQFSS